ncbi:MAG: histidinol-phosphate transaminase [Lachnospiraceae bacterium]|nr:histidinol-phosphate transaminase [Lachnospiraceae bacterium]
MSYEMNIRKVVPYTPGEQPAGKVIKLNTNECPYPPSPRVMEAIRATGEEELRKYPDPDCKALISAIASYYRLSEDQVFVGVGSDDVLSMCFLTYFAGDKPILFPDITYSFYDVWAEVYRIPYKRIPLKEDFSVDAEDYRVENGGIVLANPNAPTGIFTGLEDIERILSASPDSVVIVDEAYIDFGGESALTLLPRYENLVVTRTMSKSRALAGLRVGYAFGSPKLIKYLSDVRFSVNSYTMNSPALRAGVAAIEDHDYFCEIRDKVVATRDRAERELRELGFSFQKSSTNFIFAEHKECPAEEIFQKLKEKNIYVRYFRKPRIDNYLRISIGTEEEMDRLFEALREILSDR